MFGRIVLDDDARDRREELASAIRRERLARLDVDGLRVADEDRDADGRARDPQVRQVEDLAVLADDLPLLLGVAVREEDVDLGERIERDRVRIDAGGRRLARDVRPDLALELGQGVGAGARDGLVGVDDDPLEADGVAQRHQDRRELHRRAVRVGDDPGWPSRSSGLTCDTTSGIGRVHPPRRRVVDDGRAAGDRGGRELGRDVGAGREERDVDALERVGDRLGDLERAAVDGHGPPGRSPGGEQPQLTDREFPFVEDLDHRPSDDAGGSDDGDGQGLAVHEGLGSARSVARTGTAGV